MAEFCKHLFLTRTNYKAPLYVDAKGDPMSNERILMTEKKKRLSLFLQSYRNMPVSQSTHAFAQPRSQGGPRNEVGACIGYFIKEDECGMS